MKQVGFRGRLFAILLLFAIVPSALISLAWGSVTYRLLPLIGSTAAWDSASANGERTVAALRSAPLTGSQRRALIQHQRMLDTNVLMVHRVAAIFQGARAARAVVVGGALVLLAGLAIVSSRVAGHLSRNLSRPLHELVGWTDRIGRGLPLDEAPPQRGAPEFALLREGMRGMARELDLGRARALEAERATALRETARQVAHELKNPLTPIRFAVARLQRDVPPELKETVSVLATETQRLDDMARSFSQFGRLPEGPVADVDLGDLARYTTTSTVPPTVDLQLTVDDDVPLVRGQHEALSRALTNVMLNAVDACQARGRISVHVRRTPGQNGTSREYAEIVVSDSGCGISAERLPHIWDPYVTNKPGGTGLGLAIARQTILAHDGRVAAASVLGSGTEIRIQLPIGGPVANGASADHAS